MVQAFDLQVTTLNELNPMYASKIVQDTDAQAQTLAPSTDA